MSVGTQTSAAREALRRGDTRTAVALCREALARNGQDAGAWTLLGTALRRDDPRQAESALERALALDPANVDARFHLGNLLREHSRFHAAITAYREALALRPDHPSLWNNLGLAHFACAEHDEAERAYRTALAHDPHHRQALANLVHLLCARRRYREAVALGDRRLRLNEVPSADFFIDYGIACHGLLDLDRAADSLRSALRTAPNDATALANLGTVLIEMGDHGQALGVLQAARAAAPGNLDVLALVAHCEAHLCDWHEIDELHASIASQLAADETASINPLASLAMPLSAGLQQRNARRWALGIEAPVAFAPTLIRERGTRLRLGYLSSDFRAHPVAFLATEVWERHDRARIATFAYAIGAPDSSPMRHRISAAFEHFRDLHNETSAEIAQAIRRDGVDVLVDLNGYTTHARTEILASRPARVQVQWLGYLGTMGAPWIDGIVSDSFVTPAAMQPCFDERFLYLPDCYCPRDTRQAMEVEARDRSAWGLPPRGFVFCCFNNPYKLLPTVFSTWMRLLNALPDSVLWLSPSHGEAMKNLQCEASSRGVAPERLVFASRVPLAEHLARHVHADLYLDTTPYNAGTACNDALFMGVPVLTCAGDTMASRVAGSQLHAIGMPDLVTADMQAYETRALALARDRGRLIAIKDELARNRHTHPLFDMERFTRALERTLGSALVA